MDAIVLGPHLIDRRSSLERSRLKDGYEDHTIYNRRLAPALC